MNNTVPPWVHWEVTYACPLRCVHCYTESGRRPGKQLTREEMERVADILVGMRAQGLTSVAISGGEPLIIDYLPDILDRLVDGGLSVSVNTSGYGLTPAIAERLARLAAVRVSVDGANAATHDAIRGRAGSFERALEALGELDRLSHARVSRGEDAIQFGIDTVLTQSNFHEIEQVIKDVALRFPMLTFVAMGAVIPIGLANRESYEGELLDEAQLQTLVKPSFRQALRAFTPSSVKLDFSDNLPFQINPSRPRLPVLTLEPDGSARGLTAYEGSVGNILIDSPGTLWDRACRLRDDPRIRAELANVRSAREWARASRNIDGMFATPESLVRIAKRKPYQAGSNRKSNP